MQSLESVPAFAGLPITTLQELQAIARLQRLRAGVTILRRGVRGRGREPRLPPTGCVCRECP